ncbi:MAG: DNA polymerase I [Pirellulales bacterium]|nr:DNA polymerase I [Pirellulales bacterium]
MAKRQRQATLPGWDEPEEAPATVKTAPKLADTRGNAAVAERTKASPPFAGHVPDLKGRTVWGIDGHALIFQVFHAIPPMTGPKGEPVNAVFGFTRDLLYLLEVKRPDYLFCALDLSGPTFRHHLYSNYKIQRAEMPDDLRLQLPLVRRVLEAFGITLLELESFEADDLLATLARQVETAGGDCYLVTNDKDCRQLISDRVKLFNVRKNQIYDAESLMADWGIRPEQVPDFQALVGDSVDNVPGVPLIGPKNARELLAAYGNLEEVLNHASEVTGEKRKQNLLAGREQAFLSRELARLDSAAPLAIDWSTAARRPLVPEQILPLFAELGFHGFSDRIRALEPATHAAWERDYRLVDTPEKLTALVEAMSRQSAISLDTETTSLAPTEAELVGLSFCWEDGIAYYVPVRAPEGEPRLVLEVTLGALKPVLENSAIEKVGQNLKYDMIVLARHGIRLAGLAFDSMLASYLLDAGERNHTLDELAERYLQHTNIAISELIGTGREQKRMDEVPLARIVPYAGEDADVAWRLRPLLSARLRSEGLEKLLAELELPLVDVLVELESNGIRVDPTRLGELGVRYGEKLVALEREIYELAGREFNIASPKQLQAVLFAEQRLPVLKRTKTGPSTDADVLDELAQRHPLPAKIIEHRQFSKLKNTYVDALPLLINPRTGRVHCSFNQVVAATGRLSSSDPNLQNIPIRTDQGREIRSAFLPDPPDWLLLAADYSQIELRVLAHFSGDPALTAAFERDEDIHALVASEVYGVPLAEVSREMRYRAKAVNFGVIYGQSAFGLARQLSIEQGEAADFIANYFARYQGVEQFLAKVLAECRTAGYVSTLAGRKRAIRGVRDGLPKQLNLAERTAVNTVIQGSAADLIKLAMIALRRRLHSQRFAARMLLQIHDELVFEVPPHEVQPLSELVAAEMAGVYPLRVPLKVDINSGRNWAEV